MSEQPTFREAVERLEGIVRELEKNDLDLDRALALFEQGVRELRDARAILEQAELTIRQVIEDADGTLRLDDTDV